MLLINKQMQGEKLAQAIGRVIRLLRISNGMKQVDLAKRADLAQSRISAMENGTSLSFENLFLIAKIFNQKVSGIVAMAEGQLENHEFSELVSDFANFSDRTMLEMKGGDPGKSSF